MVQFSIVRTLEALAYVEEQGVIHNDIKSPNIMLDAETAKWARDLVTLHANAVTANDALKALLPKLTPPSS